MRVNIQMIVSNDILWCTLTKDRKHDSHLLPTGFLGSLYSFFEHIIHLVRIDWLQFMDWNQRAPLVVSFVFLKVWVDWLLVHSFRRWFDHLVRSYCRSLHKFLVEARVSQLCNDFYELRIAVFTDLMPMELLSWCTKDRVKSPLGTEIVPDTAEFWLPPIMWPDGMAGLPAVEKSSTSFIKNL